MSNVKVVTKIYEPQMQAIVGGIAQQALIKAARKTRDRAKANIERDDLVNSGKLARSVKYNVVTGQDRLYPRVDVGTPLDYAIFPEKGTRGHGPVRAQFLRFKPKGAASYVFAKYVRGVRPYGFMRGALEQLSIADFM